MNQAVLPKYKVLFVSSEVYPYSHSGGLGDVAGTLPLYLKALGHDIRIVTPRYYVVDTQLYKLKKDLHALGVPIGFGEQWAGIYHGKLGSGNNQVPLYFLDHEFYFGRKGIYNDESGKGYDDNLQRYTMLSRGALQLAKYLDFYPDIIHVNDWQTALIPVYLNTLESNNRLSESATVLTLHNLSHQGIFYKDDIVHTQLGWENFHHMGLEHQGMLNVLKGGLYHATKINAVSPTYAFEIRTGDGGHGLDGVLRDRASDLVGILNGIDYSIWNPGADPFLIAPFDQNHLERKLENKRELRRIFHLEQRDDVPLVGLVSRLAWQKGIDVVAEALDRIMSLDLQFVLLGNGEVWANFFFGDIGRKYPGKAGSYIGYNNELAHKIEAGADLFLMPSRFEPCGLNQMFSQRYGTLPIVRHTGGLADTVRNFSEAKRASEETGTGFVFHDLHAGALYDSVGWAVHTFYKKKEHFQQMMKNAMAQDFSWEKAAVDYTMLYQSAVAARKAF